MNNLPKIYIAANSQLEGIAVDLHLKRLFEGKFETISDWLYIPFLRTDEHSEEERREIAIKDVSQVKDCDIFVIVCSKSKCPGGKFVELGVALGLGKKIYAIGEPENMLMYHSKIVYTRNLEHLAEEIDEIL